MMDQKTFVKIGILHIFFSNCIYLFFHRIWKCKEFIPVPEQYSRAHDELFLLCGK